MTVVAAGVQAAVPAALAAQVQIPTTTVAENKALIPRWYDEIWRARNPDAINTLYAPNSTGHFAGYELPDPASHKRLAVGFQAAFPDAQYSVDQLFGEGDRVASLVTVRATHLGDFRGLAPTGLPLTWPQMNIHRIAGGLVAEQWAQFDVLTALKQLGGGC
jgi:predicted ester cyclase